MIPPLPFTATAKFLAGPLLWFCAAELLTTMLTAQCSSVSQVPNGLIGSGTFCYSNNGTLTAADVTVNGSANVTFVAGQTVHLTPGFRATAGTAGTTFHAWVETAPSVISVVPSSGGGQSQQFTWTVSSPSGYSNLAEVYALFNTSISGANACYVRYNRGGNLLAVADNSGANWSAGVAPGSSATTGAFSPNCTINGIGSSVSATGTQLAVTASVTFQSSFSGTKNQYLIAYDNQALNTVWQQMGTWAVPAPPPDFGITASTSTATMIVGGVSAHYPITVTPINGFTGVVTLIPAGLPAGTTFSPASVTISGGTPVAC